MSELRYNQCQNSPGYFEAYLSEVNEPCQRAIPRVIPTVETDWDQKTRCVHLGREVEAMSCAACGGGTQTFMTRECDIYGVCSERPRDEVIDSCYGCRDYEPTPPILTSNEMEYSEFRPIQSWAVGITTAPRSAHFTLDDCLESVIANGWEPIIFAEPDSPRSVKYPDIEVVQRTERLGLWRNWKAMCHELLDRFSDADAILTIQDDTVFHPQARWFAEHHYDVNVRRVYSLYTPKHYGLSADVIDHNKKHRQRKIPYQRALKWITPKRRSQGWYLKTHNRNVGLHKIQSHSLWGACAMVFPRWILEEILDHKIAGSWLGHRGKLSPKKWKERQTKEPWRIQNSDTAIGKIMNACRIDYYCPVPSLSDHIALASADGVGHGDNKGRRNAGWVITEDLREVFTDLCSDQDHKGEGMVDNPIISHYILTRSFYRQTDTTYLRRRFELIKKFSGASLLSQDNQDFTWVVNINPDSPIYDEMVEYLDSLPFPVVLSTGVPPDNPTDVIETSDNHWKRTILDSVVDGTTHILTTRLDDDDLIAPDFVSRLRRKVRAFDVPNAYTFPTGYVLRLDTSTKKSALWRFPNNQFVSVISPINPLTCVYDVKHGDIGDLGSVTVIDEKPAFVWTRHNEAKSAGGRFKANIPLTKLVGQFTLLRQIQ